MAEKLFFTPRTAAQALEMGLDELTGFMNSGHLKYALPPKGRKRRIYVDDLNDFARWYREEFSQCPSRQSPKARSGNLRALSEEN